MIKSDKLHYTNPETNENIFYDYIEKKCFELFIEILAFPIWILKSSHDALGTLESSHNALVSGISGLCNSLGAIMCNMILFAVIY